MKVLFKLAVLPLVSIMFGCQSTNNYRYTLTDAYKERGIVYNVNNQLEPEDMAECQVVDYFWQPSGKISKSNISKSYNPHFAGIYNEVVEKQGKLYFRTPKSKLSGDDYTYTSLSSIEFADLSQRTGKARYLINLEHLTNQDSVLQVIDLLNKEDENIDWTLYLNSAFIELAKRNLKKNAQLYDANRATPNVTSFDLLSLCQQNNEYIIGASYVGNEDRKAWLNQDKIIKTQLVRLMPVDADFDDLSIQLKHFKNANYVTFDGQVKPLDGQYKNNYNTIKIDSSAVQRMQDSPQQLGKIILETK